MNNKALNLKKNILNYKIKVIGINNINPKIERYNQDLMFNEECFQSHNDKLYNNTLTNINIDINKGKLDKQKKYNLNNNQNSSSQDKLIQTSPNIYSYDNLIKIQNIKNIKNKSYTPNTPNIKEKRNVNHYIINKRYEQLENNKIKPEIKSAYFSKSFHKLRKITDMDLSRNRLYPIIRNNKNKTNEIKNYYKKFNILKDYFNKNDEKKEGKRKHHNLLTIENIYFQGRPSNNNYKFNGSEFEQNKNLNIILYKKKYSIKEIKLPLNNKSRKKYNIINDKNAYLLEEIYKKQTLSNFNNKYTLKYKTNNSVKKENIKTLFSLLKKYKYSDEVKKNAFNKYIFFI